MVIYYTHAERQLYVEVSSSLRASKPISLEQAKLAYLNGQVEDSNIAFLRLVDYGWDMEAVERSYRNEAL